MKCFASVSIAVVLLISSITPAQDTSKNNADVNAKGHRVAAKKITISGRVTDDGKMLVSDRDRQWVIGNVNALNGHAGQQVTVKCLLYTEENQIHILSVEAAPAQVKYTANWSDSAFRR